MWYNGFVWKVKNMTDVKENPIDLFAGKAAPRSSVFVGAISPDHRERSFQEGALIPNRLLPTFPAHAILSHHPHPALFAYAILPDNRFSITFVDAISPNHRFSSCFDRAISPDNGERKTITCFPGIRPLEPVGFKGHLIKKHPLPTRDAPV